MGYSTDYTEFMLAESASIYLVAQKYIPFFNERRATSYGSKNLAQEALWLGICIAAGSGGGPVGAVAMGGQSVLFSACNCQRGYIQLRKRQGNLDLIKEKTNTVAQAMVLLAQN